jgi:hypothetical protein
MKKRCNALLPMLQKMRCCIYPSTSYNLHRALNVNMNVNGELKYVEVIGCIMFQDIP